MTDVEWTVVILGLLAIVVMAVVAWVFTRG
jgi:uncharacterized membrane protein